MKQKKLEEAKRLYQTANQDQKYVLESLYPELKESEDERIRKEIIDFIYDKTDTYELREKSNSWLAWLEKQCEQNPDTDFSGLRTWKYIVDAVWTEKEGIGQYLDSPFTEEVAKKLQKRFGNIEQKPVDKVEPKFHEGDWAVSNLDRKARQISEVHFDEYNSYYVVDGKSVNLEEYDRLHHLWTIQDAKDGDVLVAKGKYYKEYIFIYSKMTDDNVMSTHCGYDVTHNEFDKTLSRFGRVEDFHSVCPATKEQRNILFKKMKESGYEWDDIKKELKKIKYTRELDNSYACVKFPFEAKVKSTGAIVKIHYGQLSQDGKEWIKYQSDAEDKYKVYEPNDLELVHEIEQKQVIDYPDSLPKDNWELVHEFVEKFGRIPKDEDELNALVEYVLKRQKSTDNIESSAFKEKLLELFQNFRYIKEGVPTNGDIIDYVDAHIQELIDIVQNKPWSEDDGNRINRLIAYFEDKESFTAEDDVVYANWLKSLKDRVQPKTEWSEEDEKIISDAEVWLDTLCDYLKDSSSAYIPNVRVVISKLKSIRPQNR